MVFRVLGQVEVWDGERRLVVPAGRQRALLAYLLVHRDSVVTTDRLVDELWPTDAPPSAAKIVRNLVSELRRRLGASNGVVLLTEGRGYRLQAPAEQIDALRFERLLSEGIGLRERGDAAGATRALREALDLWRGAPFADLAGEPFVAPEAARLEELRQVCLEERIDADLALGRHAQLVPELEAAIRREPLRERLRAQLMLALYRSGRQADALAAYQHARRTLVDELGLEPGRQLHELEAAILAHDPTLDAPRHPAARVRRRGLAVVVLGAAALLLVAIAAAILVARGSETPALTALAPNTVGAIDPETGRIVAQVPLGAAAFRLASSNDVLWALSTTERTLYRVDANARALTGSARLDGVVADVAATDDEVWVLHAGASGAAVVTGFAADQAAPLRLDSISPGTGLLGAGGASFGVPDDRIALGDDTVWVTWTERSPRGGGVTVLDRRSSRVRTRVRGVAYGLTVGADAAWLVSEQLLRRVDVAAGSVDLEIPLPSPGFAVSVSVGEGAAWALTLPDIHFGVQGARRSGRGIVTRVDPETEAVSTTIPIGGIPDSIAAGLGSVWITDIERQTVVRIDPESNTVADRIQLGARPTSIALAGGLVWVAVI